MQYNFESGYAVPFNFVIEVSPIEKENVNVLNVEVDLTPVLGSRKHPEKGQKNFYV